MVEFVITRHVAAAIMGWARDSEVTCGVVADKDCGNTQYSVELLECKCEILLLMK